MRKHTLHDMKKQPLAVTIRPTPEDNRIIAALCKKLGGSNTSVIRQALRVLAAKEGVTA
jgi:hypothetical protein